MSDDPPHDLTSESATPPPDLPDRLITILRAVTLLVVLVVVVWVVVREGRGLTPEARGLLFFLAGIIPAVLFATEAAARFDLKFPAFAFTAGGGAALMFGALWVLNSTAQPSYNAQVYRMLDAEERPLAGLSREGAVEVNAVEEASGQVPHYVDGSTLIIQYPTQTPRVRVRIRPSSRGPAFSGELSYTEPKSELVLCRDLGSTACE